jgi:SAM-dependent methyltransferase
MLDVARRRAADAGLRLRFLHGDAQTHRLGASFDVAISRFGTMFFANPDAAFANIARHLRPGGRLCIATWQPLAANEWLVVPGAALLDDGTMPDTASSGAPMFSQSDPDAVHALLAGAGLEQIDCAPHTLSLCFGPTVDDAVSYLADTGPGRAVLETIPEDQRDAALAAVRRVLTDHHTAERGVCLDAAVWITTATATETRP